MRKHNKTSYLLAVFLIILLTYLLYRAPSLPFLSTGGGMLIPGPEGIDMYFYGIQFPDSTQIYKSSSMDELPDPGDGSKFTWGSTQTHAVTIKKSKAPGEPWGGFLLNGPWWWYDHDQGILRSEHERPALMMDDPIGYGSRTTILEFYVQKWTETEGNAEYEYWKKYVVYIVPADITLELSVSEGVYNWKDIKLWYVLDNVLWANAFTEKMMVDPNPPQGAFLNAYNYRGAFPLIAWVGGYTPWQWYDEATDTWKENPPDTKAEKHTSLDPSYEGRIIDLYTAPGQRYELLLTADMVSNQELLEEAVAKALPDPRFSRTAYFYITINRLGAYVQPEMQFAQRYTTWYPVVHYRIRTIWAVYGEYVYMWTKEEAEKNEYQYQNRTSQQEVTWDFWDYLENLTGINFDAIASWFKSPLGILTLALIGFAVFFLIVVGILAVTGALPATIIALSSRRRRAINPYEPPLKIHIFSL